MSAPSENPVDVRRLGSAFAPAVSALVRRVFMRFEAPDYPPEGIETFFAFTDSGLMAFSMESGLLMVGGCFDGSILIGAVALRGGTHVSLLFVEPTRHRRGIGSALMDWADDRARGFAEHDGRYVLTVNSSPYARGFYEKIGFAATGEETLQEGIRYVPMARACHV
jgi:GNAT superfamily N-acetyltransferase